MIEPSPWDVGRKLLLQWALISAGASLFFTFAPRLTSPRGPGIPVLVAILFPTLFFGAAMAFQFVVYLARRSRSREK